MGVVTNEQIIAIDKRLETLERAMKTARKKEAECKVKFERLKDKVTITQNSLAVAFQQAHATTPGFWDDPVHGEPTVEWATQLLQHMVDDDPDFRELREEFWSTRDEYYDVQSKMMEVLEAIGMVKVRARLLAAALMASGVESD